MRRYRDDGTGNIYERHGSFHVRFWVHENGQRRQRSIKLCERSRETSSTRSKVVLDLARQKLVEHQAYQPHQDDTLITDYFETVYEPYQRARLKPSSIHALNQIWLQHLKGHVETLTFSRYSPEHAIQFFEQLAIKYAPNTVSHVRAALYGLFAHATPRVIKQNPLAGLKTARSLKTPAETEHYTLDESNAIYDLLRTSPRLQLIVALLAYTGVRPAECAALRWEDFSGKHVHVRRSFTHGAVTVPKTRAADRRIPIVDRVTEALERWRKASGSPTEGWLFPSDRVKDMPQGIDVSLRELRTIVQAKGLAWRTAYAFRRGAATVLTDLTGSPLAAAQLLGHSDYSITVAWYVKQNKQHLHDGMKKFNAKLKRAEK